MTRIVASIPLVLGGLPPIGILLEDRGIYHAALKRVTRFRLITVRASFR